MPTPTYLPLATTTFGSSGTSVTFTSITQTYRDLIVIVGNFYSSFALQMRFNGDAGSNYSVVSMRGNVGGSTASGNSSSSSRAFLNFSYDFSGTDIGTAIGQIMDYSATDKHKTVLSRTGQASTAVEATVNRWANTAAINSVQVYCDGTFPAGTTISLYGVSA